MPGELNNEEDATGQREPGHYEPRYDNSRPGDVDSDYLDELIKKQREKVLRNLKVNFYSKDI